MTRMVVKVCVANSAGSVNVCMSMRFFAASLKTFFVLVPLMLLVHT